MSSKQRSFFLRTPSKNRFIVCYDVANEKRLHKIAANVQKVCMRIQRSIYYVEWQDISSLQEALQTAINILDQNEDDFRIYTIGGNTYALHSAVDIDNPCILL